MDNLYSIYRGYVISNTDKTHSGKIEVIVPFISEVPLSNLASPKKGMAGLAQGTLEVPDIGSKVWIQFELGNIGYPVYEIGEWDDDVPIYLYELGELTYTRDSPTAKIYTTKAGYIKHLETKDSEEIEIVRRNLRGNWLKDIFTFITMSFKKDSWSITKTKDDSGIPEERSKILLTDDKIDIRLTKDNKVVGNISFENGKLTLKQYSDGIEVSSIKLEEDIEITTNRGSVVVNSAGETNLTSTGECTVKAPKILLNGTTTIHGISTTPGFCSLPFCAFTGAKHTIDTVGTP